MKKILLIILVLCLNGCATQFAHDWLQGKQPERYWSGTAVGWDIEAPDIPPTIINEGVNLTGVHIATYFNIINNNEVKIK